MTSRERAAGRTTGAAAYARRLACVLALAVVAASILGPGAALAQGPPTALEPYPGAQYDKALSNWATKRLISITLDTRANMAQALGNIKGLPSSFMRQLSPGSGATVSIYTTGDALDRVEEYYRKLGFVNITKQTSGLDYEEYLLSERPAGSLESLLRPGGQGADPGELERWKAAGARLGGRTARRVNMVRFDPSTNRAVWIRLDDPYVDAHTHTAISGTMLYIKTDEP